MYPPIQLLYTNNNNNKTGPSRKQTNKQKEPSEAVHYYVFYVPLHTALTSAIGRKKKVISPERSFRYRIYTGLLLDKS
jgi:hypothetical protein